jgi:hypothetical protein
MCALPLLVAGCIGEEDNKTPEVVDNPPDPDPDVTETLKLWVEIDYHERTQKPDPNPYDDLPNPYDLTPHVQNWKSILIGDASGCAQLYERFAGTKDVDIKPQIYTDSDLTWPSVNITEEALLRYPLTTKWDAVRKMLGDEKTLKSGDKLPNLYLLAAEYYDVDPNVDNWVYPAVFDSSKAWIGRIAIGIQFNFDHLFGEDYDCYFQADYGVPVAAIFLSEIEKLVTEMNSWINFKCNKQPYVLSKMVSRVVYHELFHELYVASPEDYKPSDYGYTYCHDGDNNCKCVMNQNVAARVAELVDLGQCYTACEVIVKNIQTPCIEQHDYDSCPWVFLISYNPTQ